MMRRNQRPAVARFFAALSCSSARLLTKALPHQRYRPNVHAQRPALLTPPAPDAHELIGIELVAALSREDFRNVLPMVDAGKLPRPVCLNPLAWRVADVLPGVTVAHPATLDLRQCISLPRLAERLGLSRARVLALVKQGVIPAPITWQPVRFRRADVEVL